MAATLFRDSVEVFHVATGSWRAPRLLLSHIRYNQSLTEPENPKRFRTKRCERTSRGVMSSPLVCSAMVGAQN